MKGCKIVASIILLVSLWACQTKKGHVAQPSDKQDTTLSEDAVVTSSRDIRQKTEESTSSGEIYITVDEALKPAIEAELHSFMGLYQEAIIHPIYLPGEEAVASMLNSDSIRLAIVCRKLTEDEELVLENQYTFADYTVVGKDALALIVNDKNPADTLKNADLMDLLSGKSVSWKQIDSQTYLEEVKIVFDNRYSGAIRFLQDSLLGGKIVRGENFFALSSTEEVIAYVKENPDAIGVIGFSWISDWDQPQVREWRAGTRILAIEGTANDSLCPYSETAFKPYQTYLTTDCYSLLREIYTVRREVRLGLGTGFIAYLAGPRGQRVLHKHGIAAIKGIPRQVKFPPKAGAKEVTK